MSVIVLFSNLADNAVIWNYDSMSMGINTHIVRCKQKFYLVMVKQIKNLVLSTTLKTAQLILSVVQLGTK